VHTASYPIGSLSPFPRSKTAGASIDYSHIPSAEVTNVCSYISFSLHAFKEWCLTKHRNSFTFIKNFHLSMSSRPALRFTQSPIQWVLGALSSSVKRPGREADHSTETSAEVKKTWVYTSTPHTPSCCSA
jgi:hypothetical protein